MSLVLRPPQRRAEGCSLLRPASAIQPPAAASGRRGFPGGGAVGSLALNLHMYTNAF